MEVIDFIVNKILREPSLFLGSVALVGLFLQRKSVSDVITGTVKTIIGVLILTEGTKIIIGSILPLSHGFNFIDGIPDIGEEMGDYNNLIEEYGSFIGISMVLSFTINLVVARLTPMKNIFLTGHMLFWIPFVLIGVALKAGLNGWHILVFSTTLTALYITIMPALIRPCVQKVTGESLFTLGHTTITLSLIAALIAKMTGGKKTTEDIILPKGMEFFREIMIISSVFLFTIYMVVYLIVGVSDAFTAFETDQNIMIFGFLNSMKFGAGLTIMLQGVRMMLAEIIPSFKGISDKLIPNAIPALDCPVIFPFAPNAVLIGFVVSMITSTITIIFVSYFGLFDNVILPMTITCFFEIGAASVIANAYGGLRGTVAGSAVAGVAMIVFVGASLQFLVSTVAGWMIVFGGNDFSLLAIVGGFVVKGLGLSL